jgi:hypothetical protein
VPVHPANRLPRKDIDMPDEPPPFSGPGQPERRRPARTIDLKATEIAPEPGSAAERQQPPSGQPEVPHEQAQSPQGEKAEAGAGAASGQRRRFAALSSVLWLPLGSGIAAAALTLAIVALVLPGIDRGSDALESRVAQLEQQLADLAGRPASDAELAARLQKLETQVAGQGTAARSSGGDAALADRLGEIEAEVKSLRAMVEAASARSGDIAAGLADARRRADANAAALSELAQKGAGPSVGATNDLAARLSGLADRMGALEARPQGNDDRLARAAIIAGALAGAVERGAPFAGELAAARSEAADSKLVAALEPFAASGVPSEAALARELSALEPQLLAAAGAAAADGGILQKLETNAEKLVRIRPIDQAQAGDEPAAVIARAELKAAHDDLPGALAELARLPDPVRAPAQGWIAKVEARNAALAASRSFATESFAALGKPAR